MQTMTMVISLLSYVLLLLSVLFVTYDSPLLSNVPPTWFNGPPLSKIAVVIVLDGLGQRAWDYTMANRSSLLTNITRTYGISGVVKANVPTESRPRHTAILAGFEENIANIKTGWSRSVQPFESVFNNVEVSWAFGSESVPLYFAANIRRMSHTISPSDAEVFQDFVRSADRILRELSPQRNSANDSTHGKIVFFNFASIDLADHIEGYSTPDYLKAVVQADNFVYAVYHFFQQRLSKELMNAMTFIVTADHGVLKYGGHGGDSVNEIYVPIFIWGGGIVREKSLPIMRRLDSISGYQILLNQVDICPLIASILGIKIPSNSMGSLPVELLDVSPARKLQLLLSNNRHLQSLLEATIERIKSTSFFPFLTTEREEPLMMQPRLHETEQLIHEQRRMEGRLISRLNSFRWLTWWSFSPLWLSLITMISLNLISAALMSEPSSEVLHRRCAKYVLALVLLVECLRASAASVSPRELTLVTLLCLLAYTFLDGTAKSLRNKFKSYLANAKLTTGAPTAAIPCLRSAIIFLSFLFMLSGFYVKSLLGLSVLSTLAAQVISIKLHRMLLAYLCVVSSSLASCILLIEEFRNQEKPPNGVLM
uniref:GPI ethanolamine phosphate transferase 1 n=1 Tax=Schistocephalus solidus TaxID=70667 RepID=A0A0X3P1B0_SCHSO